MLNQYNLKRDNLLVEKIIFVDGLPGSGKTLLSYILPTFSNIEKYDYDELVENICVMFFMNKITLDDSSYLIKNFYDIKLYNEMMGRKTNVRPTDQSSIFHYPDPIEYIKRMLEEGDVDILPKINEKKPILNICTHHLLPYSEPIVNIYQKNAIFFAIVRHPAYMIKQIFTSTIIDYNEIRNWDIHYDYKNNTLPYYVIGWEDLFLKSNDVERSVHFIDQYNKKFENFLTNYNKNKYDITIIPFENFVLDPYTFLNKIEKKLNVKKTKHMPDMLKKQNVPRNKTVESIELDIYKRVGGYSESIPNYSEKDELNIRKQWVKDNVDTTTYDIFEDNCKYYEDNYWKP